MRSFSLKRTDYPRAFERRTAVCRQCNKRFPLNRRTNQYRRAGGAFHTATLYCSSRCKQAAFRKRNARKAENAKNHRLEPIDNIVKFRPEKTTLDPSRKGIPSLPEGIVADAQWPGMYRLVQPDGTLSDMVNLTRAKDALIRDTS